VADERDDQVGAMLERLHDPARVLALSDGVFAIIITLLVLEVHVPELTQGQSLNEALAEVRPSLIAFVISFVLAGMYWVGHRDLFALIRRTDRGLVWLNILYLLPLCLLPFGAGMLGRYDREPVALRIYGLLLVAIAVMRVVTRFPSYERFLVGAALGELAARSRSNPASSIAAATPINTRS
jgi:uncharacterized membrane protein